MNKNETMNNVLQGLDSPSRNEVTSYTFPVARKYEAKDLKLHKPCTIIQQLSLVECLATVSAEMTLSTYLSIMAGVKSRSEEMKAVCRRALLATDSKFGILSIFPHMCFRFFSVCLLL